MVFGFAGARTYSMKPEVSINKLRFIWIIQGCVLKKGEKLECQTRFLNGQSTLKLKYQLALTYEKYIIGINK